MTGAAGEERPRNLDGRPSFAIDQVVRHGPTLALVGLAGVIGGIALLVASLFVSNPLVLAVALSLILVSGCGWLGFAYRSARAEGAGRLKAASMATRRATGYVFSLLPF